MTEGFASEPAYMDLDPVDFDPDDHHVLIGETGWEPIIHGAWP